MANTPIYGFVTPDDTDLVKDGALAIRTALDDVDTTLGTALNSNDYAGMVLVKKQTIGTGVSSVSVTDAFSATYENYKILISGGVGSATGQLFFKLNGITTNDYFSTVIFNTFSSSTPQAQSLNNNYWNWFGAYNTSSINAHAEINSPFLSDLKIFSAPFIIMTSGTGVGGTTTGFINSTSSATGFTIETSSGTLTGGTIYVYGYGAS